MSPLNGKPKERKRSIEKRLLKCRNTHKVPTLHPRHRLGLETPPKNCISPKQSTNKVWENIVLHYLNKLRNSWRSNQNPKQPTLNLQPTLNSYKTKPKFQRCLSPEPCKSDGLTVDVSKSQLSLKTTPSLDNSKNKAMHIVTNALEYGQAKGLISKNGKFFWLRDEKSLPEVDKPIKNSPHKNSARCRCCKSASMSTVASTGTCQRLRNYLKMKMKQPYMKKYRKRDKYLVRSGSLCKCNRCKNKRH